MSALVGPPPYKFPCFVVFNERGVVKIAKTKAPTLGARERMLRMTLVVPRSLFEKPTTPEFNVVVGDQTAITPEIQVFNALAK